MHDPPIQETSMYTYTYIYTYISSGNLISGYIRYPEGNDMILINIRTSVHSCTLWIAKSVSLFQSLAPSLDTANRCKKYGAENRILCHVHSFFLPIDLQRLTHGWSIFNQHSVNFRISYGGFLK